MKKYSLLENTDVGIDIGYHKLYAHMEQSMFVIDGIWETDCSEERLTDILRKLNGELLLVTQEFPDSILVACLSLSKRTKAIEFLDFIFGEYGLIKGNGSYAQGRVSTLLVRISMKEIESTSVAEFFMERAEAYFDDMDKIIAANYVRECPSVKNEMRKYVKKNVPWAFVLSTDIADEGKEIIVRTLEIDSGVSLKVSGNVVIMIGCKGEIYEISYEKFKATYEPSDEKLNIYEKFFDYIPAVELPETKEYITIDELAHLCYPKKGGGILAKKLEKRTKVFRKGTMEYFVGNPGDYLAVRCDDEQDVYIIQEEVFLRTYELPEIQ